MTAIRESPAGLTDAVQHHAGRARDQRAHAVILPGAELHQQTPPRCETLRYLGQQVANHVQPVRAAEHRLVRFVVADLG